MSGAKGVARVDLSEVYAPGPKQLQFHQCASYHTRAFSGGVGSGKTTANVMEGLKYALEHPGSHGMFVGASYPQLSKSLMPELQKRLSQINQQVPFDLVDSHNQTLKRIILYNGSYIYYGTAQDPEALAGSNLAWYGMDEAALCKERAFEVMNDRLREPSCPHRCWLTYTPLGLGWWTRLFEPESDEKLDGSILIRTTTMDNPATSDDYKQRRANQYTGQHFKQFVLGIPQRFKGKIWPDLDLCETDEPLPESWVDVLGGLDFGWTSPGALILLGLDSNNQWWAFGEHYECEKQITGGNEDEETWADVCHQRRAQFGVSKFFCDPSSPEDISNLRKKGLHVVPAANDVIPGIRAVSAMIAQGLKVKDCPHLLNENYVWQTNRQGEPKGDKPRKQDDHASDALRYVVYGTEREPGGMMGVGVVDRGATPYDE